MAAVNSILNEPVAPRHCPNDLQMAKLFNFLPPFPIVSSSYLGLVDDVVDVRADELVDLLALLGGKVDLGLAHKVADVENKGRRRVSPSRHLVVRVRGQNLLGLWGDNKDALGVNGKEDLVREVGGHLRLNIEE